MHTVHREIEPEFLLEPPPPPPLHSRNPQRRRKRLLVALAVLLVALFAVFLKDWDFWFPPASEPQSAIAARGKRTVPEAVSQSQAAPSAVIRDRKPVKPGTAPEITTLAATTERAALPDLQVEVIAGNQRKTLPARSNAIDLDLASSSSTNATQVKPQEMVANSNHVQMSAQTSQSVNSSVAPDYPLLARQMKVQGAVILQALISREGTIQELQILSGPAILSTAAREAVKQWRFKPYYQNGQPVETEARITVNFTISTN